jgi:hypothetical protein
MATDKAEPRVGLIFQVGILAIVTLLAARAFLQAYFDRAERAEIARKLVPSESLSGLRAEEKRDLSGGPVPIDHAMQMLAAKGRMGASPDIMPSASKDTAPLQGWTRLPSAIPAAFGLAPAEPPTPAPATSASGAPPASAAPSAAPPPPRPAPHRP